MKWIVQSAMALVIVGIGLLVATVLYKTRPRAEMEEKAEPASLVTVAPVAFETARVRVEGMGTLEPAKRVVLQPEVAGRVMWVAPNLEPGGFFQKGDALVRLDKRDYEVALAQKQSLLQDANVQLALEGGQRAIAKREWDLLRKEVGGENSTAARDLVLRKPQHAKAEAALKAAEAALRKAELDLSRTTLEAPFNCLVTEEKVEVGQYATPQTSVATLVGTNRFWARTALPVEDLRWVELPDNDGDGGASAEIHQKAPGGDEVVRYGKVARLYGDLEPAGRMARLLVEVPDPLQLNVKGERQPLLLGAYVRVAILGKWVRDVAVLPREAVHDGDTVWIFTKAQAKDGAARPVSYGHDDAAGSDAPESHSDGAMEKVSGEAEGEKGVLEIRPVTVIWRERNRVFVSAGLKPGERYVTSRLSSAIAGMPLRLPAPKQKSGAATPVPTRAAEAEPAAKPERS